MGFTPQNVDLDGTNGRVRFKFKGRSKTHSLAANKKVNSRVQFRLLVPFGSFWKLEVSQLDPVNHLHPFAIPTQAVRTWAPWAPWGSPPCTDARGPGRKRSLDLVLMADSHLNYPRVTTRVT